MAKTIKHWCGVEFGFCERYIGMKVDGAGLFNSLGEIEQTCSNSIDLDQLKVVVYIFNQ